MVTETHIHPSFNFGMIGFYFRYKHSIFIDISRIIHLKMNNNYFHQLDHNKWSDIVIFIEQTHNLSSFSIRNEFINYMLGENIKIIQSILPRHLKYLQIPIDDCNQIAKILEQCPDWFTITFEISNTEFIERVIDWFEDNTINTTCQESAGMVHVWLGKEHIQSTEINHNNERIKLTENDSDS